MRPGSDLRQAEVRVSAEEDLAAAGVDFGAAVDLLAEAEAAERTVRAHVTAETGKWRARFVEFRLDGLSDDPRPGRPPSITAEQVEDVVVATLESTPANATHWSRAKMAERTGLSKSTIGRIWKTFELKPHRADTFKLSNDPLFVDKVFDVVGLYLDPPEGAVVLCVDEKSQVQALARSQPAFPMMPGMPEKRTHDYVRHGTTNLFAALNVGTGEVVGECRPSRDGDTFLSELFIGDAVAVDGHITLSGKPGMGVELNEAVVSRYLIPRD